MNILYISNTSGSLYAGPTYSIPKQIHAQSKIDRVFWYNLKILSNQKWKEYEFFHDLNQYSKKRISNLPSPFNNPDLIIFQGVYPFSFCKIVYEIWKLKIPYIIVARGALTKHAQSNKNAKKKLANFLMINKFLRNAKGIHYLTDEERQASLNKWKNKSFVIPNGYDVPVIDVLKESNNKTIISFIGRIDIFHKGIDLLIDAVHSIQNFLIGSCEIHIYGPDINNSKKELLNMINKYNLESIVFLQKPVFDNLKISVLKKTDIFILTSRFEGHPMALIEALAYGVPCIVTYGTNMGHDIVNGNAGWSCEAESSDIAETLKTALYEYKSKKELFSENAHMLARKYDWKVIASKTNLVYNDIINKISIKKM